MIMPVDARARCMWVIVWLIAAKLLYSLHSHHPGHFRPSPLMLCTLQLRKVLYFTTPGPCIAMLYYPHIPIVRVKIDAQ